MNDVNFNIPDNEFIASFCNRFSINRANGDVVMEFYFAEPPKSREDKPNCKLIKRIAMSISGAEKFCNILRMAITKKDNPPSEGGIEKRI